MTWTRDQVEQMTRRSSVSPEEAEMQALGKAFREYKPAGIFPKENECSHCHEFQEQPEWIHLHPASGCKLCQKCLTDYIEVGIEEDGKDTFQGWEFRLNTDPWGIKFGMLYVATNDEQAAGGQTVADCVESVLIKLKLI